MSNAKSHIREEVERTLACFQQAERITPDPWFGSRVRNRIALQGPVERARVLPTFRARPLVSALLALILVANLMTALAIGRQRVGSLQSPETDDVSRLASAYGYSLAETDLYLSNDY